MPSPIAINFPDHILDTGFCNGFNWLIAHNGIGFRCGYVEIPDSHPWYQKDYNAIDASVHGGLTYSEQGINENGTPDNTWWIGFDCAHYGDAADPSLPAGQSYSMFGFNTGTIKDNRYVGEECIRLCEQAEHPNEQENSES